MADPTQNDENKKPVGSEGTTQPAPVKKEEVSAADLLSLWGGGASPSKPAQSSAPASVPAPKPTPPPVPVPVTPIQSSTEVVKPAPSELKPIPAAPALIQPSAPAPKSAPPPAPKPEFAPLSAPKPPAPESEPSTELTPPFASTPKPESPIPPQTPSKPIQPETAFWEVPKKEPVIEEPIIPKSKPVPPSPRPPAFIEEPIVPKSTPAQPPLAQKSKPPVKIDQDIFEPKEEAPVKEIKKEPVKEKAPKEIFEGEIISSQKLPPLPPPPEEQPENLDEENGLGSQVDEFLAELNLSRKHIFYGIGCLILIIVLIFGGIWGYKFYKNRAPAEPKPEQQQQQPQTQPQINVPDTSTGIVSTQELGKLLDPNLVGSTGINSTTAVGVELTGASGISSYIMTFKRLQNAYETDINELLNQATDRRGRLNSHLALLGKFYVDGTLINSQIQQEAEQIKIQYEEKKKVQQAHDSNFFDQIKALNPQTTENILSDFINVSKEIVVLRARFKALQKVKSYYNFALPKLNARIKDIELNAEPLILGLKVYDVKGSDLKLIIPIESSADATQNESLESSSGAGLFINPASVSTGHDYIQSPGGGF